MGNMKRIVAATLVAGALLAGWAAGQGKESVEERLQKVRREVKIIDLHKSITRVPELIAREKKYEELLGQIEQAALHTPKRVPKLLEQGRQLKLAALKDLNSILRLHRGKHIGLTEAQIYERLKTRFLGVTYTDEWLVNILDDLEESCQVNIELDARVYKFDSVTFDFESTSARAMLQIMADQLLYKWVVRGDTLYVYKERNEVLFGKRWKRNRDKARKEREKASKEKK